MNEYTYTINSTVGEYYILVFYLIANNIPFKTTVPNDTLVKRCLNELSKGKSIFLLDEPNTIFDNINFDEMFIELKLRYDVDSDAMVYIQHGMVWSGVDCTYTIGDLSYNAFDDIVLEYTHKMYNYDQNRMTKIDAPRSYRIDYCGNIRSI